MKNIYSISAVVCIVYFLIKFIEIKYISKEVRPFKLLVRDSLLVFLSALIGIYGMENIHRIIDPSNSNIHIQSNVFTDNPTF
jgi:hypothetical protein